MSSITEQFSAATKSQLEVQFQIFNTLASTAVDSAEKFIALNINTTKASVEKSSAAARQLLAIKDPQEFFSLSASQPPSFDALLAYGRELFSIASSAQSELVKSAQSSFKNVSEPAVTKVKATPPALAAAVSAAVTAANEPLAVVAPAAPKVPKAKPLAAPIPDQQDFIEVKADLKPSFPAPPPKPEKSAPKAKK
ncbi:MULTISPECIES: phasin family protein [unclassified Duganella]|uniref:phasin family protein n=1 Tax=unclassified Duganella TaxID=2636909 RepID=UPI0008868B1E|nr:MULTISPECIES: phasin family protein [unclassified Duganella]SDF96642.1 phasin family protein [Duganella sp. OV458]SDJ08145.1 phasin family protein [Duganella sp. OV510]